MKRGLIEHDRKDPARSGAEETEIIAPQAGLLYLIGCGVEETPQCSA